MPITFSYSREYLKDVKRLRKRYRLIQDDIDTLEAEMQQQEYRGDFMPGYGIPLYKVRLTNRSARRGKSGGFCAIYHAMDEHTILFLHLYSKSDKPDVEASDIWHLLRNLG